MWFWNCLIHRALWFAIPLFLLLGATVCPGLMPRLPVLLIAVLGLSAVFASVGSAPWLSWMSDLLPDRLRGRFWTVRYAFIHGAMLASIFVFGWMMDLFPADRTLFGLTGFILVFTVAVLFGVIDVFIHYRVVEPAVPRPAGAIPLRQVLVAPLRDREFFRVVLCVGVWQFALYLVAPFSAIFLKEAYQVTYTHLSWSTAAGGVGGILGAFVGKMLLDRMGARTLSAVALVLYSACMLVWFFMKNEAVVLAMPWGPAVHLPQPILALMLVNIPCGLCGALLAACQTTLITSKAPGPNRTMAMALYQGGISLLGAGGSIVGGYLVDAYRELFTTAPFFLRLPFGEPVTYFHVLTVLQIGILWLVLIPLHLRLREEPGGLPFRTALLGLVTGNPMRMVASMFNLHALESSGEPTRKLRAIRELGDSRTAIAVADLVAQLDDPDADVREEAVMALGRIGSPEAIGALLVKLGEPDSDLQPEIAKAFRKARDPRVAAALLGRLSEGVPAFQIEAARTLGAAGDKRAVRPLLDLLYASRDEKVIAATSEALARLGEMDAIFQILPRMRETRHAVVKRSMGCAVGDLLGRPGEFYRVFHAEQQAYGTAVATLLGRLKEQMRKAAREASGGAGAPPGIESVDRLESAYLLRDYAGCVRQALDLAIALSSWKYGIRYGGEVDVFAETLIWHDQPFGVGTWYLDLHRQTDDPDGLDALLAIYFVSTWTRHRRPA